jgi:mRNA interferase YafQ
VISHLQQGIPLDPRQCNHHLREGRYKNTYECHISADWLLVYRKLGNALILIRTGSHADLF